MKPKTIVTVVILSFVAVAVAYLVVKEVRQAKAPEVAREEVSDPAPVATGEQKLETGGTATAAAPEAVNVADDVASNEEITPPVPDRKVIVTYYYTSRRCASCLKIEAFSREAVETGFSKELKDGKVVWGLVNVDEAANNHYIDDYQLYAKSVIVADVRDGEEVRWKNLTRVWQLTNDKNAFIKYIQDEVRNYLEAG